MKNCIWWTLHRTIHQSRANERVTSYGWAGHDEKKKKKNARWWTEWCKVTNQCAAQIRIWTSVRNAALAVRRFSLPLFWANTSQHFLLRHHYHHHHLDFLLKRHEKYDFWEGLSQIESETHPKRVDLLFDIVRICATVGLSLECRFCPSLAITPLEMWSRCRSIGLSTSSIFTLALLSIYLRLSWLAQHDRESSASRKRIETKDTINKTLGQNKTSATSWNVHVLFFHFEINEKIFNFIISYYSE